MTRLLITCCSTFLDTCFALVAAAIVSTAIIVSLGGQFIVTWQGEDYLVGWHDDRPPQGSGRQVQPVQPALLPIYAFDDMTLQRLPSISAVTIDRVLASYSSPAQGTGPIWIELGQHYGIDPAYALAFFIHESTAGTNPGWAGLKPGGGTTHNIGNIICAGYATCYGRFRDYPDWQTGIEDWYRLIRDEYIEGRRLTTVDQILPIYAPSFENNVPGYVNTVEKLVITWRQEQQNNLAGQ